jgi:hypothetical protein
MPFLGLDALDDDSPRSGVAALASSPPWVAP